MRHASAKQTAPEKTHSLSLTKPHRANPTQTPDPDRAFLSAAALGHDFNRISVYGKRPSSTQPYLRIHPLGDEYEQEPDRIAQEKIHRLSAEAAHKQVEDETQFCQQPLRIQRKPLEVSTSTDAEEREADEVARRVVGQPSEVHATSRAAKAPESQSTLRGGNGQPLDDVIRPEMESRIGADFRNVRIHTGAEAHHLNEIFGARAFTSGQDVYFRNGEFNSRCKRGKELLAHELVHTVQRGQRFEKRVQRQPVPQSPWETDKLSDGNDLYYRTEAEANRRKAKIELDGKWEQCAVESFNLGGKEYWRVRVRGVRTIVNFLTLLRRTEKAYPNLTKEQLLNSLRRLGGYDTERFQAFYGTTAALDIVANPAGGLSQTDVEQLEQMLRHGGTSEQETGVIKDFSGEYLAMGHVMTGISGGLHRNKTTDLRKWYHFAAGEKMDNLYATTLAGDLGQSAVLVNEETQEGYIGQGTEATDAEVVGDIDGLLIGEALSAAAYKKQWDATKTLSNFIESYYKLISKERFAFAEKMDQSYLRDQITRFAETFAYRNDAIGLGGGTSAVGSESEESYQAYEDWLSKRKIKGKSKKKTP